MEEKENDSAKGSANVDDEESGDKEREKIDDEESGGQGEEDAEQTLREKIRTQVKM